MPSMTIPRDIVARPLCRAHASSSVVMGWAHGEAPAMTGLPYDMPPDWQGIAVRKLRELVRSRRSLRLYLDACVRCGACTDACPFFLATGDPLNMPVARADLMRSLYRRHIGMRGRLQGGSRGVEAFPPSMLAKWFTYFHQCSACGRCSRACPLGIDTAEITLAAREIMASIGVASGEIVHSLADSLKTGNSLGLAPEEWRAECASVEQEVFAWTGLDVKFPVDTKGSEVLLLIPAADLITHRDTMVGYGILFHHLGISWTTASSWGDASNYGFFLGPTYLRRIHERVLDTARNLEVSVVMWGESGHGWRAARIAHYLGLRDGIDAMSFLKVPYPYHVCAFTAAMIAKGALKVDKSANNDRSVTVHDPCNLVRTPPGDLTYAIRQIIAYSCNDFREMPTSITGENTLCCGAGGGLYAPENIALRMDVAKPRAVAAALTGANYVAAPCDTCKAQLSQAMAHWHTPVVVGGVAELPAGAVLAARGIEPFRSGCEGKPS